MTQKKIVIGVVIAVAVLIAAVIYLRPKPDLPKPIKINTTNQPTLGKVNPPVHIVIFEDLKCINCARFDALIFPQLKKEYIDTGKAKYTVINLAFIEGSMPAANAARCLYKQNKDFFFPYINSIYHHQPAENENWTTIPRLMQFANHIAGVDKDKLSQCIAQARYTDFIESNLKQASKIMTGPVSTPTLYVNGMIAKPLTMKRLRTLIKAAD